mgnify:FL=1|tara:strand:- start:728 stop:1219 length:492 start_codon:yes stop_codon:yes gene_type:complete
MKHYLLALIVLFSSCSISRKMQRKENKVRNIIQQYPGLAELDTISVTDSVYIPELVYTTITTDTCIDVDSIQYIFPNVTVTPVEVDGTDVVVKEITMVCPGDTVYIETIKEIERVKLARDCKADVAIETKRLKKEKRKWIFSTLLMVAITVGSFFLSFRRLNK